MAAVSLWRCAVVWACVAVTLAQVTRDPDAMLNWCLDARHHKIRPGPEDDLHKECTPWKQRSCCTAETSRAVHTSSLYGFNLDHCPGRRMSERCRRHFIRDHCFYECSPNVGPWVTKVDMKIRKERYYGVPLCASQCIDWFEDCKDDFTCTDNWTRNFRWVNGTNHCPAGAGCFTFHQVYQTADNFCQTIWDGSWKFTSDDQACMQMWFQAGGGNPNDAVARLRAAELAAAGAGRRPASSGALLLLLTAIGTALLLRAGP